MKVVIPGGVGRRNMWLCVSWLLLPVCVPRHGTSAPGRIQPRETGTGLPGAASNADVHGRDIPMHEPNQDIWKAAEEGLEELVRELLQSGISANEHNAAGLTPLHIAASTCPSVTIPVTAAVCCRVQPG